jgi:hypothetical protein
MDSNLTMPTPTPTLTQEMRQNDSQCPRQAVDSDEDFEWATEGVLILGPIL